MTKDDIIFSLDSISDGWQTSYTYSEVCKAMDLWAGYLIAGSDSVTHTTEIPKHILKEIVVAAFEAANWESDLREFHSGEDYFNAKYNQ